MTDVHTVRTYTFCHGAGITSVNWTLKGKYNEQAYFLNYQVPNKPNEKERSACLLRFAMKCKDQPACVHVLSSMQAVYSMYTSGMHVYIYLVRTHSITAITLVLSAHTGSM